MFLVAIITIYTLISMQLMAIYSKTARYTTLESEFVRADFKKLN